MNAAEWQAMIAQMVENLEHEIQVKRGELTQLVSALDGARRMAKLPPSLLKNALSGKTTRAEAPAAAVAPFAATSPNGEISIRGAMREAIASLKGEFTNADVFAWMTANYPGVFKPEHSASVSSVMAKFGHKGLIRQVKRGTDRRGVAVLWEKVPGKWTEEGVAL